MKKNPLYFIGLLAFAIVSANGKTRSQTVRENLRKCAEDMKLSSETVRSAAELENLNDKNVACLLHCTMIPTLTKNGKLDLTSFVESMVENHQFDEQTKQAFVRRMEECKKKAEQEADECFRMANLVGCIKPFLR